MYACDDDTCVAKGSDCDGRADCPDGSDEFPRHCGESFYYDNYCRATVA